MASGAVQPQVSNSQWSALEESKRERGRIIFRSQEQLWEMCCIDHKLEHLLRGSRMFRYVFCFGRKAATLHVFCENGPEVSVELLKQFGPPPVHQMATNSTLGSASTSSYFFQQYNYLDISFQPFRCRARRCCSPTLTIGTLRVSTSGPRPHLPSTDRDLTHLCVSRPFSRSYKIAISLSEGRDRKSWSTC